MAVEGHLHKIVFGGSLCGTESWSVSLHYLKVDIGTILISGALAAAVNSWFSNVNLYLNASARLDFIKANELDPLPRINAPDPKTGLPRPASPAFTRYLSSSGTNEVFFSPGTAPNAGATVGIPQASLAVSLTTTLSRGLASKGRIYLPTSAPISADGRTSDAYINGMLPPTKTMFLALNSTNTGKVVVYSGVRGQTTQQVTGLRVGHVVDTQRRRRRNLLEDYLFMPLT